MKKRIKNTLVTLVILILIVIFAIKIAIPLYASEYYKSKFCIKDITNSVTISKLDKQDGYSAYFFDGQGEDCALIFYPGALVETESYGKIMAKLAEAGVDCFLIDAPYYMAILEPKAAKYIIEDYKDQYDKLYVSGHSMGGVIASKYASYHYNELSGLILLASYSIDDLSNSELDILSIYGSNDEVLNAEAYEKNKSNLGDNLIEHVIEGGNHAGFGEYGEQKGDGDLEIDNQIELTSELIINFINE